jgi:hypothetical protein
MIREIFLKVKQELLNYLLEVAMVFPDVLPDLHNLTLGVFFEAFVCEVHRRKR